MESENINAGELSKLFPTFEQLQKMTLDDLSDLYNNIIDEFELTKFEPVNFKSTKTLAVERVDCLIWIAAIKAERDNLKEKINDMLLNPDLNRMTEKEKIYLLWELLVKRELLINSVSFLTICQNFDKKLVKSVWEEKTKIYGLEEKTNNEEKTTKEVKKIKKKVEKDYKCIKKKLSDNDGTPIKAKKKQKKI